MGTEDIVLILIGGLIAFMHITSIALDQISDEMEKKIKKEDNVR